jgi:hypothetical protein
MNSSAYPSTAIAAGPSWTYLFVASTVKHPVTGEFGADGAPASAARIICLTGLMEVQTSLTHTGTDPDDATQLDSAGLTTPGVPAEENFFGRVWQKHGGIGWIRARGVGGAATCWYNVQSK